MRLFTILFILTFTTRPAIAQNLLQEMKFSGALDLVQPGSMDDSPQNDLQARAVELMLYGAIDQTFNGVINFAGHSDEGEFEFGLHEGYVETSKLLDGFRFKAGKFFLNAGRLNQFHQHDWAFSTAPKTHREFFVPGGETLTAEGAADTGFEATAVLPTESFIELTLGATANKCYGHCHQDGPKPPRPLIYFRPTLALWSDSTTGTLLGATYLTREDAAKTETELYGLDWTYKKREGQVLKWLVQSELQYQTQKTPGEGRSRKLGAYVLTQYGRDKWSYGLRLDAFSHLNMKFETTAQARRDFDYGIVPQVTYQNSEFSYLRFSYVHEVDTTQGAGDVKDRMFLAQLVYFLGAHPAHSF